ncbi:unnamed protein product, partial [Mesorhabditis spiculigera]
MLLRTIFLCLCYTMVVLAEPLSLLIGAASLAGVGLFVGFKDKIKCKITECCDAPYVSPNFYVLREQLNQRVFGQHIVLDSVVDAIETHWNGRPTKPLVMSFHGFTGCGKNYVSQIIAENIYKNGMRSRFVQNIVATADFPDGSRVAEYEEKLRDRLMDSISACGRSLFIIDEVDKMPERLLSSLKPFMDHHKEVGGRDFRKAVFLLLSNKGSEDILKITLAHHEAGHERTSLRLKDFEGKVAHETFNRDGGLKMSEIISNHLIDHYVPFLPLERVHLEKCIYTYLERQGRPDLAKQQNTVKHVADQLQFFPKGNPIYSSSGCKRVNAKADLILAEENRADGKSKKSVDEHKTDERVRDEI